MKARKFHYTESSFLGPAYSIEWKHDRLQLKHSIFSTTEVDADLDCFVKPSDEAWSDFERKVRKLNLVPVDCDDMILDGTQVDTWITFRYRLVQFSMTNPEFKGYARFRDVVNELTVCPECPNGLFKSNFCVQPSRHGLV